MVGRQTLTPDYWTKNLTVTDADVEHLFSIMLEDETPLSSRDLTRRFVERRVRQEEKTWQKQLAEGDLFQPKAAYEVGQRLVFPALDFASGEVTDTRPGSNPDQGDFTVLEVAFEGGVQREFAAELEAPHVLNLEGDSPSIDDLLEPVDVDAIIEEYGDVITEKLEDRIAQVDDAVYAIGQWFLTSLMPEIDLGQRNLAEAILDMNGGGPLEPAAVLEILDLPQEINPNLQSFALSCALYEDKRFDEVGPAGKVFWYLNRMKPEAVLEVPERLVYTPVPYSRDLLSEAALELEAEIADELSPLPVPKRAPEEVQLTLIYPHRLSGTLPLTPQLSAMFPKAYEAQHVLVTLVDVQTGESFDGWVVRDQRYVVGLEQFYRTHKLPVGAFVTVRSTDDPSRFEVDYQAHRPRTEWIRLASTENERLVFQEAQRSIGAVYDDLMVLGVDDLDKVEHVWQLTRDRKRSLVQIVQDVLPALAELNRQRAVHAKTLYSAVNVVRRCPPGPILAALEAQPEFEQVEPVGVGHYWRYVKQD